MAGGSDGARGGKLKMHEPVPEWQQIRDAARKKELEKTARLRAARLAAEAAQPPAPKKKAKAPRRPGVAKGGA